ncbi:DEP domain-containing mTOR-interacting protein [Eucyclogobius newberryi]|uniref:DEP domain-containing mTOR-interacting protein n=1 Tax=Eucyclogobius newberryi TaxID=166745 RepID=UPI003B5B98B8
MERTSSVRKKIWARQHKSEVMIAGEQFRLKLHDGKLIKERRYHLRTYPNCLVGQELIDWLVSHKEAPDRTTAVCLMQHLMDHDIVHHVCDKYLVFKDAKRLYRFRKDDGTFPFNTEVKIFMRGQQLYEQLIGDKNSILQLREEHGVTYQRAFPGCQLIDWIIQNGEAESRSHGLELCRALQEHGIIQHVSKKHNFFDSGLLYQFCINFRRRRRLSELLNDTDNEEGGMVSREENHHQESPFLGCKNSPHNEHSGFQSDMKSVTSGRRGSLNSHKIRSDLHSFTPLSPISTVQCNPKSVLTRNFTCEELLAPGAPFIKKVLTVIGDALGWGFVVRGTAPCYVQAVDPGSPAAAAGIKVRQFVCQVNGQFVLYMDYRTVTRLVMTGNRTVVVEVMEPLEY